MKCDSGGSFVKEKASWIDFNYKYHSFNGSCLLEFLNKKGGCVLVHFKFSSGDKDFFGVMSRLLEERKTEVRLTSRLSVVRY